MKSILFMILLFSFLAVSLHADSSCGTFRDVRVLQGSGSSPVIGDFNGDGKQDLAVIKGGPRLAVRLGIGDATFQEPITIPLPRPGHTLAAGDVNRDGWTDLVVTQPNEILVLVSQGVEGFAAPRSVPTGLPQRGMVLADLNGDGNPDVLVKEPTKESAFFTAETTERSPRSTCFQHWAKEGCWPGISTVMVSWISPLSTLSTTTGRL